MLDKKHKPPDFVTSKYRGALKMVEHILDFIDGQWTAVQSETLNVMNPASAKVIGEVVLTPAEIVARAVEAGHRAFQEWRYIPVTDRIQCLFKLKVLLEENIEDLAQTITNECGKTYQESI